MARYSGKVVALMASPTRVYVPGAEREENKHILGDSPSTDNHVEICFSGKQTELGNIVGNLVLAVNLVDRLSKDSPDTDIDYG